MSDKSISHAISGGLSGLVSMALTYPLVTLSTNAQAKTTGSFEKTAKEEEEGGGEEEEEEEEELLDVASTKSVTKLSLRTLHREVSQEFETSSTENKSKENILFKIKKILSKVLKRLRFLIQHSKKFYAGLESALVGIVAVNFFYYYIYNLVGTYLKKLNSNQPSLTVKDSLITGLTAGIISRVITNPIWVANTRMTVKQKMEVKGSVQMDVSKQNTFKVMYEIFKNEGLSGLFSGLGPALILVSSPVIQFTIFEQSQSLLIKFRQRKSNNSNITSIEALILGSFGKLIAILLTYPYYTIRSRMHLSTKKNNSFKILYDMIKIEGLSSLYSGLNAKLLQSVVSAGLIFYFKEEMISIVGLLVDNCNSNSKKAGEYAKQIQIRKFFPRK